MHLPQRHQIFLFSARLISTQWLVWTNHARWWARRLRMSWENPSAVFVPALLQASLVPVLDGNSFLLVALTRVERQIKRNRDGISKRKHGKLEFRRCHPNPSNPCWAWACCNNLCMGICVPLDWWHSARAVKIVLHSYLSSHNHTQACNPKHPQAFCSKQPLTKANASWTTRKTHMHHELSRPFAKPCYFRDLLGQASPYRSNAVEKTTLEIFAVFHMDAGTFALTTQAAASWSCTRTAKF